MVLEELKVQYQDGGLQQGLGRIWRQIVVLGKAKVCDFFYIASSVSGEDIPNPAM